MGLYTGCLSFRKRVLVVKMVGKHFRTSEFVETANWTRPHEFDFCCLFVSQPLSLGAIFLVIVDKKGNNKEKPDDIDHIDNRVHLLETCVFKLRTDIAIEKNYPTVDKHSQKRDYVEYQITSPHFVVYLHIMQVVLA